MKSEIEKLLRDTPKLKGAQIAKKIGADKSVVNAFLYKNTNFFTKDADHCWSLANSNQLTIRFPSNTWITCTAFEDTLKAGASPWDPSVSSVIFVVPERCKILLEAGARLLALCNQLTLEGKDVTIDLRVWTQ